MNDRDWLCEHWNTLAARIALQGIALVGVQVLQRYAEPHRVFHTHRHLRQVLDLLEQAQADTHLLLAAWFHDAVYRPGHADNEARSAELARQSLGDFGYAAGDLDVVCRAVMATASHRNDTADFAPLLDADLAILGAPQQEYAAYRTAIRQEFHAVPEFLFRRGRRAFLRSLLDRPAIFATQWGLARFEDNARRNLASELAEY